MVFIIMFLLLLWLFSIMRLYNDVQREYFFLGEYARICFRKPLLESLGKYIKLLQANVPQLREIAITYYCIMHL